MSRLLKYREKLNLTQDELAKKSGISVRTIQRIEAGRQPKGYTLKVLSQALGIMENELIPSQIKQRLNSSLIKLINLSSLPFVIIPFLNIIIPLIIMYWKKEVNSITKQIVSIQILWTIISTVIILVSPFISQWLALSTKLVLLFTILLILLNVFIIIRNTAEIDKNNRLFIKLSFSFI